MPKALESRGKRFWKEVTDDFELGADDLILLENACGTPDLLAKVEAELVKAPLIVPGSQGQLREHPLLSEARQQRVLLARTLAQLKLPEPDVLGSAREATRSTTARPAARARWSAS